MWLYGSELLNDDFNRNYPKVRPICRVCRAAGKEPSNWGLSNLNKKQKM